MVDIRSAEWVGKQNPVRGPESCLSIFGIYSGTEGRPGRPRGLERRYRPRPQTARYSNTNGSPGAINPLHLARQTLRLSP